ncbi:uncharacterized protein LOC130182574 [Seriola aureovittata]|uniref:uncharacterized protein LOC130182574 n=1 Tax=Seriola aureovittata TaxID=2871759 RepID=UPI0024BDFC3C|nr:uncharacterized protein LOC130182574 [Seriola aureovittata]
MIHFACMLSAFSCPTVEVDIKVDHVSQEKAALTRPTCRFILQELNAEEAAQLDIFTGDYYISSIKQNSYRHLFCARQLQALGSTSSSLTRTSSVSPLDVRVSTPTGRIHSFTTWSPAASGAAGVSKRLRIYYLRPGVPVAEVETLVNRGMEGSSEPRLPDPPKRPHSQTDSFLTAARLLRRAWAEEGKKTGRQISHQPPLNRSEGNQGPKRAEIYLKDPGSGRKTTEGREVERKTDEVRQMSEGTSSAQRQAEPQKDIVLVWRSGCRSSCRQTRRFKAPILPVIAEM